MNQYKTQFQLLLQNRKAMKRILDSLGTTQLNLIPAGFNNNILWQAGHILSVQQMLTYGLSDMPFTLPVQFINEFAPGTKPSRIYDENFIIELKEYLVSSYQQLSQDAEAGKFQQINPFMTALKYEITDFEGAISFDLYHEAMHMGHVLNLMRFVLKA